MNNDTKQVKTDNHDNHDNRYQLIKAAVIRIQKEYK